MKQKGMLPGKQCMCLNVFYTGVKGKKQVHCSNGFFWRCNSNTGVLSGRRLAVEKTRFPVRLS